MQNAKPKSQRFGGCGARGNRPNALISSVCIFHLERAIKRLI
jgi:hypothetical protein